MSGLANPLTSAKHLHWRARLEYALMYIQHELSDVVIWALDQYARVKYQWLEFQPKKLYILELEFDCSCFRMKHREIAIRHVYRLVVAHCMRNHTSMKAWCDKYGRRPGFARFQDMLMTAGKGRHKCDTPVRYRIVELEGVDKGREFETRINEEQIRLLSELGVTGVQNLLGSLSGAMVMKIPGEKTQSKFADRITVVGEKREKPN